MGKVIIDDLGDYLRIMMNGAEDDDEIGRRVFEGQFRLLRRLSGGLLRMDGTAYAYSDAGRQFLFLEKKIRNPTPIEIFLPQHLGLCYSIFFIEP